QQAATGNLVALGVDVHRVEVAVRVLVGHPLLPLDLLEAVELHDPTRRLQVVEDRLVPGEALEAHDLFGEECSVLAELDVPLARDVAEALVEGHAGGISPNAVRTARARRAAARSRPRA